MTSEDAMTKRNAPAMRYADREDYKTLLDYARRCSSRATVHCSSSPRGGYVVNVRTAVCHVRVWALDMDDAFEAARCALREAGPSW